MRKAGMSFCVFIALGLGIGCAQTNTSVSNTSSQIMKLSATSTGTSSLLAAVPATSRIAGYEDFKFGMTASEVFAVVKKVCMGFEDRILAAGIVVGKGCYGTDKNKPADLQLWHWAIPVTGKEKAGDRPLVYVSKEAALYSRENLRVLDQSVSSKYPKTSQMSESKLKQLEDGHDVAVGNLYAGGQVALVVERNVDPPTPLKLYIRYCDPKFVDEMHDPYKP